MSKSILVTGSNSGFGRLIVETLAKDGHTVFATMRGLNGKNREAAESIKKWSEDNNYSVHTLEMDVTGDEQVVNAVKQAVSISGRIDAVVNNAGVVSAGLTEAFNIDQVQGVFDVNVFGSLRVNKAVLPYMRKQKSGLLIQISSTVGRITLPFLGVYSATKYAIESLAESYRSELAPLGVDSTIIEPGAYPTEIFSKVVTPGDADALSEYGELANAHEAMFEGMGELFQGDNAPNPQDIADAVKNLIDAPHGERPLRTVVDAHTGHLVEEINRVSEKATSDMSQAFESSPA